MTIGEKLGQTDVPSDVSWKQQLKWLNELTVAGCSKEKGHKSEML